MAIDLSLFPDQPKTVGTGIDLSAFPDQPTSSGLDLSAFPDQPVQDAPNILQRSATSLKSAFAPPRPPLEDPSPHGDIRQGANFRERFGPLTDPNIVFPFTTQGRAGDIRTRDILAPITTQVAGAAKQSFKEGKPFRGLAKGAILPEAVAADVVGTGASIFTDIIQGAMKVGRAGVRALKPGKRGKKSFLPFGEDVRQQFLGADRGFGKLAQEEMVPRLERRFDRVVKEGMDPVEASKQMFREMAILGIVPDVAEEVVIQAIFFGPGIAKKGLGGRPGTPFRRGTKHADDLAAITDLRAELRAVRAQETLEAQAGKVPLLTGPGPGARPPVPQGQVGPIAGRGFTIEAPGALAKIQVPKKGAPRAFGKGGQEPSIAAGRRIRDAAEEERRLTIFEKSAAQPKAPKPKGVKKKIDPSKIKEPTAEELDVMLNQNTAFVEKMEKLSKIRKLTEEELSESAASADVIKQIRNLKAKPKAPKKVVKRSTSKVVIKVSKAESAELREIEKNIVAEAKRRKINPINQIAITRDTLEVQLKTKTQTPSQVAFQKKTIKQLDIVRDKIKKKGLGEKGSAEASRPKKTSAAEKAARIEKLRAKVDALKLKKSGKVSADKASIGSVVDKNVEGTVKFKRRKGKKTVTDEELVGDFEVVIPKTVETVDKAGRKLTQEIGGTVVGNTKVGEMVKAGEMTEREGKILMAADKINPIITSAFETTTREERIASIGSPKIRAFLKVVENSSPKEFSALHDTPVSQALAIAKRAQEEGVPIMNVMDDISQDLLVARKVANVLGVNLNAIRRSAARGELRAILEKQLDTKGLNALERKQLREALKQLGSPLARTRLTRTLDMVTKYGINAMLSSPVTFMRNLVGSAIGVGSQIPTKIAQATVSNIFAGLSKVKTTVGLKPIKQTERVFFREVGPELVGILRGFFGRGLRKGGRFLKHEEISKVFKSIEDEVVKIRATHIPKGQQFSTLKRNQKAALLKQLRRDLTDLLTEEEVTRAAELGFAATKESVGILDKIINIPVRNLVATDKVFQTASASGHIAARRVREAIRTGKSVKTIHLTKAQIEEAKIDAAFNVFRQKLGPTLGGVQNLISETPLMPLMIPFLKSRINFAKFFLKHSPLGLIETVVKSTGAKALDTKSAARALSGTAMIFAVDKYFEANSDNIQLQPSAGSSAERAVLRESGLGEQVVVFGTNLNNPKKRKVTHTEPYANLAPISGPLEVIALKQEYYRRKKRGFRADEAFAATFNKAMKGVLNQSAFGSVKEAVRAGENMADSSVAINADGTPEKSSVMSILTGSGAQVANRKLAGVIVPNIVRDVRKLLDKRIFDAKTLGEHLRVSLPPVLGKDPAKGIPVRQTVFGADAKQTQKRLPFSPFAKKQKIDRTIEKMFQLEIFPAKAPKKLSLGGAPIVLTEEEQRRFNFLGPILKTVLDDVVSMDGFNDIPEIAQKQIIQDLFDNFRTVQSKVTKGEGLLRLIQSDEGIQQIIQGVTEGFSPF